MIRADETRNNLSSLIIKLKSNKSHSDIFTERMIENLKKYNIDPASTIILLNSGIPFSIMSDIKIGRIYKSLLETTRDMINVVRNKISESEYNIIFSDSERNEISGFREDVKIDIRNEDLIFENTTVLKPNKIYNTYLTSKQISELFSNLRIGYDEKQQRALIQRKYGDKIISVIDIKREQIETVKKTMLAGTYYPTMLSLNINYGGEYDYEEISRTLTLKKGTDLFIIDGMTRCISQIQAIIDNPNINIIQPVNINMFTVEESGSAIVDINEQRKITGSAITTKKIDTMSRIVKELNENDVSFNSPMIGRIGDNDRFKIGDFLVSYSDFVKVLKILYNNDKYFKQDFDRLRVTKNLTRVFTKLEIDGIISDTTELDVIALIYYIIGAELINRNIKLDDYLELITLETVINNAEQYSSKGLKINKTIDFIINSYNI